MVLFHELLHVGLGEAHSPFLDRKTFEGLATDRVYSCTDLCFRPGLATQERVRDLPRRGLTAATVEALGARPRRPDRSAVRRPGRRTTATRCPSTACTCCEDCPAGVRWVETMEGHASGPLGSYVRINLPPSLGVQITCGSWSNVTCPGPSAGILTCCQRQAGQPNTTTFTGTLPFPFVGISCLCGVPPPTEAQMLAQLVTLDNDAVDEDSMPITCP